MMVSRTPLSSQISRGGVACCSNFSTWSHTGTRCLRRGRSAQSFLCSNMETSRPVLPPISLASCAFKIFERLICTRIAPHISERLCGGRVISGGAQTLWFTASSMPSSPQGDTHFLCVCAHPEGLRHVLGRSYPCPPLPGLGIWRTIANFLCSTLSQSDDVSHPWVDSGIVQGRVLSPLLFNLLVNSLAAAISRASPGVRLSSCSDFRLSNQPNADDFFLRRKKDCQSVATTTENTGPRSAHPAWRERHRQPQAR